MKMTTTSPPGDGAAGRSAPAAEGRRRFWPCSGGMGMGKTGFTRGLAPHGLDVQEPVSSPSYLALVNEYAGRLPL